MNFTILLIGVLVAVLASLGQVFFKLTGRTLPRDASMSRIGTVFVLLRNRYFIPGCLLFSLSVLGSIYAMRIMDFSVFYSISALNYLFIALLSKWMLREPIDSRKALGTAIVTIGVGIYVMG